MSHQNSYQIECPDCARVADLEHRADNLQVFIRGVLPRASWTSRGAPAELTDGQQSALDWAVGIKNTLRHAMEDHPRCHACTILMGPGHTEPSSDDPFCGTHGGEAQRGAQSAMIS